MVRHLCIWQRRMAMNHGLGPDQSSSWNARIWRDLICTLRSAREMFASSSFEASRHNLSSIRAIITAPATRRAEQGTWALTYFVDDSNRFFDCPYKGGGFKIRPGPYLFQRAFENREENIVWKTNAPWSSLCVQARLSSSAESSAWSFADASIRILIRSCTSSRCDFSEECHASVRRSHMCTSISRDMVTLRTRAALLLKSYLEELQTVSIFWWTRRRSFKRNSLHSELKRACRPMNFTVHSSSRRYLFAILESALE